MKNILVLNGCEALWFLYKKELSGKDRTIITKTYKNKYRQLINSQKPSVVIIDNMIPIKKQEYVLKTIRKHHKELPIIHHCFLSGHTAELRDLFLARSYNLGELKHKTAVLLETQDIQPEHQEVA